MALGHTQPPVCWVLGFGWVMKLTTHLHLVPRLRMRLAMPSLPHTSICQLYTLVSIQVLTAVSIKMTAFWDIAPCSLIEVDLHFIGACFLRHHGNLCETTWFSIPEGCNFKLYLTLPYAYIVTLFFSIYHCAFWKDEFLFATTFLLWTTVGIAWLILCMVGNMWETFFYKVNNEADYHSSFWIFW
jgi:hypothetical protein